MHPTLPDKKKINGTDTVHPIQYDNIPSDPQTDVTYTGIVCEVRLQKEDPNCTCIIIGGNRICYPGDTSTKTRSLKLVKLLLNSVLSQPDGKFACFSISNFDPNMSGSELETSLKNLLMNTTSLPSHIMDGLTSKSTKASTALNMLGLP